MTGDNLSAEIKADVSLSAIKSQALPLALVGLSAISLIAGFAFLAIQPEKCWLPFILTGAFAYAGIVLWLRSHKASELEGGSATEIHDAQRGLKVLTDSRSLESPGAVQHLAELFALVAHRSPLPEPDGMVDAQGSPQPFRKEEAKGRVEAANMQAESIIQSVAKLICPPGQVLSEPISGDARSEPQLGQHNIPFEP